METNMLSPTDVAIAVHCFQWVIFCENITCPLHTAHFDVTTGKKVREPSLPTGLKVDNLPNDWKKYLQEV
jgi:nitrite reductase/ring-hydroxylating ferredoxin subunit